MSSYMLLVFLLLALSQGITDRVIISLIDFMHWFQWFDWFADVKVKDLIRWWLFWWGGRQHCWLQFGWVLDRLSSRFSCLLFDWIGSGNSTNQVTGSVSNVLACIKWIKSWSIQGWWKRCFCQTSDSPTRLIAPSVLSKAKLTPGKVRLATDESYKTGGDILEAPHGKISDRLVDF